VIASEDHGEYGARSVVPERMDFAVYAGQGEVRSGGADGEDRVIDGGGLGGGKRGSEAKKENTGGFHGASMEQGIE
jgi:hypothetical protein